MHRLVEEGAVVLAADLSEEGLAATAATAATPAAVTVLVGDVSDPDFAPMSVDVATSATGRLDLLVNAAGILRFEHTIAYLGSDDASHVIGAELRIDGGTHS